MVEGNSAQAKKKAVAEALKKGVEGYVTGLVGPRAAAGSFERLTEEVMPGAEEAVQNFHILAEYQSGEKYRVLIKVRINEEIMQERLRSAGVLLTEVPVIKVLFLVSEVRGSATRYWWKDADTLQDLCAFELALNRAFQERGFSPVNRILSPPDPEEMEGLGSSSLKDEEILRFGSLMAADVVVYGQCRVTGGKALNLTLRALDVHVGREICQASCVEPAGKKVLNGEQLVEVLEGPVNRLATRLCPCIMRAVAGEYGQVRQIVVTITGMTRPGQFWVFRDFLKDKVAGVESVVPSRILGDSVSATVEFQGEVTTFKDRVLNHEDLPFPLSLVQDGEGEIVFRIE